MPKSISVELGKYLDTFVEKQIREGRFQTADEVVRAGLRLLEEEEAKLDVLRAALIEGEQSGLATPFDFDEFIERKRRAVEPAK
jgi:antitoxin ParD1/3/4